MPFIVCRIGVGISVFTVWISPYYRTTYLDDSFLPFCGCETVRGEILSVGVILTENKMVHLKVLNITVFAPALLVSFTS